MNECLNSHKMSLRKAVQRKIPAARSSSWHTLITGTAEVLGSGMCSINCLTLEAMHRLDSWPVARRERRSLAWGMREACSGEKRPLKQPGYWSSGKSRQPGMEKCTVKKNPDIFLPLQTVEFIGLKFDRFGTTWTRGIAEHAVFTHALPRTSQLVAS